MTCVVQRRETYMQPPNNMSEPSWMRTPGSRLGILDIFTDLKEIPL